MNEHFIQIHETLSDAYVYFTVHYYYYIGVLIRMCFSPFNLKQFIRYSLASLLLVQATIHLLELNGSPAIITLFICMVLGFTGQTGLQYAIDEAIPQILKVITEKSIEILKTVFDKVIDKIKNK